MAEQIRPHLANGLPAWNTAPDIALPRIQLSPKGDASWSVSIMLGSIEASRYVEKEISDDLLNDFLADWRASPELCCADWFETEPPSSKIRRAAILSSEDIGI